MKLVTFIQLEAAFLSIVFSLNTVIGFACSMGMDLGLNVSHHQDEAVTKIPEHVHADGKRHEHQNNASKHHGEATGHDHTSKEGKDNCCADKVVKFAQVDKSLSPSFDFQSNTIFITTFVSLFYNIDILAASQVTKSIKYFVQSHHPPISDIRIAIQSFQI